jgi:hypothetical protein
VSGDVPKGWRAYGLTGGFLATIVVVLAVATPWFERFDADGSQNFTPWPFTEPDSPSVPDNPFLSAQLAGLVLSQEWGLIFVIAAASGALIAFIAAAKRPTEDRMGRAVAVNLIAAAVSLVMTALMWASFGVGGAADSTTALRYGFVVAAPAQLAWLGCAVAFARIWSRSRRPLQTATA